MAKHRVKSKELLQPPVNVEGDFSCASHAQYELQYAEATQVETVSVDFIDWGETGYDLVSCNRCSDLTRIIVESSALVDDLRILKRTRLWIRPIPAVTQPFFVITWLILSIRNSVSRVARLASRVVNSEMAIASLPMARPT